MIRQDAYFFAAKKSTQLLRFLLLVVCLGLGFAASAQEFRAMISGRVLDPSGAAIAGARITVTGIETGSKTTTTSDSAGNYNVPYLALGSYRIEVSSNGFEGYIRNGIVLDSGSHPIIDLPLKLGDQNVSVTVTTAAPIADAADAATGDVITREQVEDIPLNGRTPLMLAQLSLGVTSTGAPGQVRPFDNSGPVSLSIGGSPVQSTEIQMDGSPDSDWQLRVAYNPPLDAVAEVRTYAFQPDAAYGHTGGGFINQITRSGTNSYHGTAYEYNQVSALRANLFFNDRTNTKKSHSIYNQYGGSLSGPVRIPHLFDGRDKLQFLFSYEGIHDSAPFSGYTTVPTAAEKMGDFSQLLTVNSTYQIYDPNTGVVSGTNVVRSPFANNIIPTARINPVAQNLLQYYPAPNVTGGVDGTNNYFSSNSNPDRYATQFGRVDYSISTRNKLFADVRHNYRTNFGSNFLNNTGTGSNLTRANYGATVDDIQTINATTVADVRVNWTQFIEKYSVPSGGFDQTSLGLPAGLVTALPFKSLPLIQFGTCANLSASAFSITSGTSYQCLGPSIAPQYSAYDSYQLYGTVTKLIRSHAIKVGGDARNYRKSQIAYGNGAGLYTFGSNFTKASNAALAAPIGQDFASFLLGLPQSGQVDVNAFSATHTDYVATFIQDDWRVTSNLTLNIGARYDHDFALYERDNRAVNGFNTSVANPIQAAAQAAYALHPIAQIPVGSFVTPGGLTFASSSDPQVYHTPSEIVSPRFGFAWTPGWLHSKTVVRGGYGVFVAPALIAINTLPQSGYAQTTSLVATNNNYLTPAVSLSNPFPAGLTVPSGNSKGLSTFDGLAIAPFPQSSPNPYTEKYMIGIQQELELNTVFEIAYIGSHIVRQPVNSVPINNIPRQYLSTSFHDNPTIALLSATVSNPFAGLLPGTTLNGSTTTAAQLLTPYPQYPLGGVQIQYVNNGSSEYNSLNLRLNHRFSMGFSTIVNYSWSKLIESISYLNNVTVDGRYERRLSAIDRPQRVVIANSYQVPVGKGRRLNIDNPILNAVAGGFSINTVYTFQMGPPVVLGNVDYYGGSLNFNNRQTVGTAFATTQFLTSSSGQPTDNIRTLPSTNGGFRQDGIDSLDASVLKEIPLYEKVSFQLRFEAFNVLNHPTFGAPNVTPTSTAFGVINSQYNSPRQLQIAGKLRF